MNWLKKIGGNLLKEPGDTITAKVTKTKRKVLKIDTSEVKQSRTVYPNDTIVDTIVYKKKKK